MKINVNLGGWKIRSKIKTRNSRIKKQKKKQKKNSKNILEAGGLTNADVWRRNSKIRKRENLNRWYLARLPPPSRNPFSDPKINRKNTTNLKNNRGRWVDKWSGHISKFSFEQKPDLISGPTWKRVINRPPEAYSVPVRTYADNTGKRSTRPVIFCKSPALTFPRYGNQKLPLLILMSFLRKEIQILTKNCFLIAGLRSNWRLK